MKKIFSRTRDHGNAADEEDEGLKASPYEDTAPRPAPRVGERPIRGNLTQEPPSQAHQPPSVRPSDDPLLAPKPLSSSAGAGGGSLVASGHQRPGQANDGLAGLQQERAVPTNFSRLPVGRPDVPAGPRSPVEPSRQRPVTELPERNLPPTPAAIEPSDLANPEFSYLSRVYGKSSESPNTLNRGEAGLVGSSFQDTSRPARGLDESNPTASASSGPVQTSLTSTLPSRSQARPPRVAGNQGPAAEPQGEQGLPRKQIGTAQSTAVYSGADRREGIGPSDSEMPAQRSGVDLYSNDTALGSGRAPAGAQRTVERGMAEPRTGGALARAVEGDTERPSLDGIVDLSNTVDTEIIIKQAPAVVHETVVPTVHHVREEKIVREIHTHDVYHRILPVIDVEVLPPRHFVPDGRGGLREVSADDIPGRVGHWGIVETVSKDPALGAQALPVQSSQPEMVSTKSAVAEDGTTRIETTWRHPPTMETGAQETGQSWPLLVSPEQFEEKHGVLPTSTSAPRSDLRATGTGAEAYLPTVHKDLHPGGPHRNENATVARQDRDLPTLPQPDAADARRYQTVQEQRQLPQASSGSRSSEVQRKDPQGAKPFMPGAFPALSSSSTATFKTLSERQ